MLNIQLSNTYYMAHDLLLQEDSFLEEVVAEASLGDFHLTCSIGMDRSKSYITWNLRYFNQFLAHKTVPMTQFIFNAQQLEEETHYKFRQFLWKAANRSDDVAIAATRAMHIFAQ